jgi:ribosomal subunit interface protein
VDIVVKGRHTEVPERFRQHVAAKLAKLGKIDGRVINLDVELSKEHNRRQSQSKDRIEITCRSRGPVIRAEACADDPYAALDLAFAKMEMRLRRAADRRRIHRGRHTPVSVAAATATLADRNGREAVAEEAAGPVPLEPEPEPAPATKHAGPIQVEGDGPLVVREKVHRASPMTLDQALYEMELVGHDFYLFIDSDTKLPSVVYRRRGYDYGVIRLDVDTAA